MSATLDAPMDWSALLAQAEEHGVLPLMASRLQERAFVPPVPEIRTELEAWQRAQSIFTLSLSAHLFRALDSLAAVGIEVLVTKGPVLSVRCYGSASMRQYADLDLIVRDRDIERVTHVMLQLRYEPRIPLGAIQAARIPGEYTFMNSDRKVVLEFHTERTLRYHPRPVPIDKLFQRQTAVPVDGRNIPTPSLEDELVLICVHGAKHFWERLVWIADVAALISAKQPPDWSRAMLAAREVGAERILLLGLRLASDVLGAQLPAQLEPSVQSDRTVAKLAAQIENRLVSRGPREIGVMERAAFRMRMRGGLFAGAAYLLRLSLYPTEDDWTPGREGNRPAFMDAIGRPLRLAKKHRRRSDT
ncbi:MAG: hypothetical protein JWO71_3705 [Candidatus Acidoferrum typicum]|nr:hypothetical protein [Candidatus Acidoferrum typicum]